MKKVVTVLLLLSTGVLHCLGEVGCSSGLFNQTVVKTGGICTGGTDVCSFGSACSPEGSCVALPFNASCKSDADCCSNIFGVSC